MAPDSVGPGRGERAADFVLPLKPNGQKTRFYARAGGTPSLLVFFGSGPQGSVQHLLEEMGGIGDLAVFGVNSGAEAAAVTFPLQMFRDEKSAVSSAYGLGELQEGVVLVLDANLRVLGSVRPADGETAVQELQSLLGEARKEVEALEIGIQAPVLLIPHVLDREVCEFLTQVWHNEGNQETGVEQSRGTERAETIDHGNKSRSDHIVMDEKLIGMLSATIGRRVMPEIQRAFAYTATRFEGFKIACYDSASGGFFNAHRDNLSPATVHRRFALSLSLNEGYEGGFLRFPEFGPHLYRPEPGCAVVFSCSHLHEVTLVTGGRRFVLLSFLFGEERTRDKA